MNLAPTAEQRELQEGARRLLEKEITRERLLAWDGTAEGYDRAFWESVTGLGWIGFSLPESLGGGGGTFLETALLLEECGRGLAPAALPAAIAGARAISLLGGEAATRLVPALARGERQAALAFFEEDGTRDPRAFRTRLEDGRLTGGKSYVRQGVTADRLLVAAREGDDLVLVLVEAGARGVSRRELRTFGGDRQSAFAFDGVAVAPGEVLVRGEAARAAFAGIRREVSALALAEAVGGFGAVLDMTIAYMKERVQFGQPLGKFQGVQFKCADLATSYAGTRHAAFQAIWRISEGLGAARELAVARAWCGEAFKRATLEAHQLHGGAGYVVEHPLPRHSARAQSLAILFADETEALGEIADELLGAPDRR